MAEEKKGKEEGGNKKRPILIKKIKKVAGGHHGGAWKVAYADFVTAMMAFFLLLWLLNVTTKEQLNGIADYFKPTTASVATSGAGGVMGGLTMTTEGAQTSQKTPAASTDKKPSDVDTETDTIDVNKKPEEKKISQDDFEKMKVKEEEQQFQKAMQDIKQAINDDPTLKDLAKNLIVDMTPEGLRIQIVDQQGKSMFPLGSAQMYDETYALISKVAQIINKMPQKLSIRGHTDSVPYGDTAKYDNWNLSADRANASRQALVKAGLAPARISNVAGKADTEHLFPKDPTSPQNRRISIILLRDHPADPSDIKPQ
jgi:chemotaxis protein MotB